MAKQQKVEKVTPMQALEKFTDDISKEAQCSPQS